MKKIADVINKKARNEREIRNWSGLNFKINKIEKYSGKNEINENN